MLQFFGLAQQLVTCQMLHSWANTTDYLLIATYAQMYISALLLWEFST